MEWIPSFASVKGKGWFKPGYDLALGANLETLQDRDRMMKAKGAVEACGGGDVGIGNPGPTNPRPTMPLNELKRRLGK